MKGNLTNSLTLFSISSLLKKLSTHFSIDSAMWPLLISSCSFMCTVRRKAGMNASLLEYIGWLRN